MPPKRKGQNIRGRDKIFRNAVEHVHIGVGHAALGNLSLQLAAGPPPSSALPIPRSQRGSMAATAAAAATAETPVATLQAQQQVAAALLADRPAFYTELNAQMLSHTSKDFKAFRWQVLERCETRPLFLHHRYEIARALLDCLLARTGGTYSSKSKAAAVASATAAESDKGQTSEAFEAFARLTIAFVRDLQADFFPFYEVFQEALQAGMFDKKGILIADVTRLQLVYSVQAAWCRELAPHWLPTAASIRSEDNSATTTGTVSASDEANTLEGRRKLIRRVVALYVRQLHDTKEYIRRLAAEWLAGLCRQCHPMVQLVCELASGSVLAGYESAAVAQVRAAAERAAAEAAVQLADGLAVCSDGDDEDGVASGSKRTATKQMTGVNMGVEVGEEIADESADLADVASATAALSSLDIARDVWHPSRVRAFIANDLPVHPVLDGLSFLAAELYRGMRGAVSTSFERFYVRLLKGFLLIDDAGRQRVRKQQQSGDPGHALDDLFSSDDDGEGEENAMDGVRRSAATAPRPSRSLVHSGRWGVVFGFGAATDASAGNDSITVDRDEEVDVEGATCVSAMAIRFATSVVRALGSQAMGAALEAVLAETRRHSARASGDEHSSSDDGGVRLGKEDVEDVTTVSAEVKVAAATRRSGKALVVVHGNADSDGSHTRPSHRLLNAVVMCLDASSEHHLRLLSGLLCASHYFLWSDTRERALLQRVATALRRSASRSPHIVAVATSASHAAAPSLSSSSSSELAADEEKQIVVENYLGFAAALLESLYPLWAVPYLVPDADDTSGTAWLLELQQQFLPAAKACLMTVAAIGYGVESINENKHEAGGEDALVTTSETAAAARTLLFAHAQDILQKHFAFCLAEERRLSEWHAALNSDSSATSADDEGDDDDANGVNSSRQTKRRRRHADNRDADREDAYVEEHDIPAATGSVASASKTTAAHPPSGVVSARRRRGARAPVVPSLLTPLALTLLHATCEAAWTAANAAFDSAATAVTTTEKTRSTLVVSVGVVDQAVLLARLASDRTRHMRSSPLQQLLRLAPRKTSVTATRDSTSSSVDTAGAHLSETLERFLQHLVKLAVNVTESAPMTAGTMPRESRCHVPRRLVARALDWLSAALPLVGILSSNSNSGNRNGQAQQPSARSGSQLAAVTSSFLALLRNIKASTAVTDGPVAVAASQGYAVYVRVSVMLLNRMTDLQKKRQRKTTPAAETAGVDETTDTRQEGFRHLSAMILVLARGFRSQQQEQQSSSPELTHASSRSAFGDSSNHSMDALPSDESRARLFHAAELLMDALLSAVGVDSVALEDSSVSAASASSVTTTAGVDGEVRKKSLKGKEASERGNEEEENTRSNVDAATATSLRAVAALQDALPDEAQRALVEVVLLESLTAPTHAIRTRALRLLRLLCHPRYPLIAVKRTASKTINAGETHRDSSRSNRAAFFVGAGPVDPTFFDALLAAEEFNPLSQTGNLDGVRQALARIAFAAEAGTIVDPLERVVLARAMIGLLSMKFADAWPVALKILAGLVKGERTTALSVSAAASDAKRSAVRPTSLAEMMRDGGSNVSAAEGSPYNGRGCIEEADENVVGAYGARRSQGKTLEPIVWHSVIARYARLIVLGDVIGREAVTSYTTGSSGSGVAITDSHMHNRAGESDSDIDEDGGNDDSALETNTTGMPCVCFYRIKLTDFEHHQRGELVSKAFSQEQYMISSGSGAALVSAAAGDGDVICWSTHATELLALGGTRATHSTDRATVAKTFLSALEEMMKTSSQADLKLRLVEDLVFELVAIQRGEHPALFVGSGGGNGGGGASKKLDDRLSLAMRACSTAPTTVLTQQERARLPAGLVSAIVRRSAELEEVFISYTSDANAKLQRAALDNLKRLRVEPFCTHHAQLTPYCDSTKALFGFLSSFHVETDIPPETQTAYISAALSLALPKLIANVPHDKKRDQAVLRRRMMGFITHLSDCMAREEGRGRGGVGEGIAAVLDKLVQQLVFSRVTSRESSGTTSAAGTLHADGAPRHERRRLQPADFDFLATWRASVARAIDAISGSSSSKHGRGGHCTRQLERLCRQLLSTTQLLDALLHAVGTRFVAYVESCMHLALQSYLVACKQMLVAPLDEAVANTNARADDEEEKNGGNRDDTDALAKAAIRDRVLAFASRTKRALGSSAFSAILAQLRRTSLPIVAQLFEQFPEHVAKALETSPGLLLQPALASQNTPSISTSSLSPCSMWSPSEPLLGVFLTALGRNSRGVTRDGRGGGGAGSSSSSGSAAAAAAAAAVVSRSQKSYVTPVLRLLSAWAQQPALLSLFPLFPSVAVETFQEVFAVTDASSLSGGSTAAVHRASAPALHEGLSCLNALLEMRNEPVAVYALPSPATGQKAVPAAVPVSGSSKSKNGFTVRKVSFDEAFLFAHVVPIFAAVYRLVVRGADAGENDNRSNAAAAPGNAAGGSRTRPQTRDDKRKAAARSIMSFSISTWKALMQTTALLAGYVTESGKVESYHYNRNSSTAATDAVDTPLDIGSMLARLAEVALHVVTHPACIVDRGTCLTALDVVDKLLRELPARELDARRHFGPLVHLANVVTLPEARLRLCGTLEVVLSTKMRVIELGDGRDGGSSQTARAAASQVYSAQLAAVGRAIRCLNSFDEGNTDFSRYDFELRYHTYHSLIHFFNSKGNYGAWTAGGRKGGSSHCSHRSGNAGDDAERAAERKGVDGESGAVRKERDYTGDLDVRIPTDARVAPLLCVDGFLALTATVVFLLRDPESTIRALSMQLIGAMMRYASTAEARHTNTRDSTATDSATVATAVDKHEETQQQAKETSASSYAQRVLEEVVRRELLPSLRRGVVAKDVSVRADHMAVFGFLGRYYSTAFPSFAALHSPNTEQNFFLNVGHAQPTRRLHALAILRREAINLSVRDVLRVFVPFLMCAVKDFAQGKRELRDLTEAKARGYCEAVLTTIASIAHGLPWEGYYRILTLFLANASVNASLRMPMLRGVVHVLNHFHFLDEAEEGQGEEGNKKNNIGGAVSETDEEEEDELTVAAAVAISQEDAEAALVEDEVRARRRQFRHQRIMQVLEHDVLPQLFGFIGDGDKSKKALGMLTAGSEFKGMQYSVSAIRKAQEKEDKAATSARNAILQLPVAIAITKIAKKFPEDRFDFYVDHILDEVVVKLRTKNDKHRDSARRILGVLLRETGPSKLRLVMSKLKDNLVHGYQLHVLGYTIVTLLYQLYEPHSAMLQAEGGAGGGNSRRHPHHRVGGSDGNTEDQGHDVMDAVHAAARRGEEQRKRRRRDAGSVNNQNGDGEDESSVARDDAAAAMGKGTKHRKPADPNSMRTAVERKADDDLEAAEEELLAQLMPYYAANRRNGTGAESAFDHAYGVRCLTDILDELMAIFLDDYLGEVGMQKEQTELMSTMVEVKRNRSLQGFSFLARHCEAGRVMEVFLQRMTWVLTPPSDGAVDASQLHGSARARALLMQELRSKYLTVNKSASADLVFINKVRLLATRIARGLMSNPTMRIDQSFAQVRELLDKHNAVREAKIRAFEAREGTRRIRGSAHVVIHKAHHDSWKEQLDKNFLVEAVPERVDVDFSSHTVLATQQKHKLRVYKGRYGKEVREAAKDFYREDPTTAVVLDTLDEFLMKFLLSVLKRVLGIGKESKYTAAAVQLDLLRRRRQRARAAGEEGDGNNSDDSDEEDTQSELDPADIDASGEDDLDAFADAQQVAQERPSRSAEDGEEGSDGDGEEEIVVVTEKETADGDQDGDNGASTGAHTGPLLRKRNYRAKLSIRFTVEYRSLLESLVPSVLTSLQGEGSDPVVANALDCLLALVSLRPPLAAVQELNAELFSVVTGFIGRGGSIKQRAMRVCAAVIAHQPFRLADDQASQLMKLVRAEVMDRSPFLAMALAVFYAVIGKHNHVVEVYDMIDIVTELMVHLSTKPTIVRRCVMIIVRFLTEFKLTADAFRSHMDLLCKNLDYPELTGRLALLDCLDTLVSRLPVRVLRGEAPFLLVPLAATITSGEWRPCRERAGRVLQNVARFAGVDVLAPTLANWLTGERTTRPQRTMAAQVWATVVPALAKAYHLPDASSIVSNARRCSAVSATTAMSATEEDKEAFLASCEWSLSGVLAGCLYDQFKAAGGKFAKATDVATISRKDRAMVEMKGWTLIFYSLRCAEAMLVAMPDALYPRLAAALIPAAVDRLATHTHPWVQSVALRLLRHYCYTYVEQRCLYLQEGIAPSVVDAAAITVALVEEDVGESAQTSIAADGNNEDRDESTEEEPPLPYILMPLHLRRPVSVVSSGDKHAKKDRNKSSTPLNPRAAQRREWQQWCAAGEQTMDALAALLKSLLSRVGLSDVANEHQRAHRVLSEDTSRTEGLKLMVYASKALAHTALSLLVAASAASGMQRYQRQLRRNIQAVYASVFRHIHALARPAIEQRAVTNYVVRVATLVQLFGAFVSVLPQHLAKDDDDKEEGSFGSKNENHAGTESGTSVSSQVNTAVQWLLVDGMHVLSFVHQTVRPVLSLAAAVGRSPAQTQLRDYAHHSATVIREQLEERRVLFDLPAGVDKGHDEEDAIPEEQEQEKDTSSKISGKRTRSDDAQRAADAPGKRRRLAHNRAIPHALAPLSPHVDPTLDTVLTSLAASLAHVWEARKEEKIAAQTKRQLKRNRHDMEREERRGYGGGGGIGRARGGGKTSAGNAKMAVRKRFGGRGRK